MYLWVILATLLAALAGYILPLRSDMVNVVDTPVAQAMMIQMVVKHKAGLKYMERNGWPFACPAGVTQQVCEEQGMVSYAAGDAVEAGCADYITFGFVNNASYTNEIRCLCNLGSEEAPNYTVASNCNTGCTNNGVTYPVLRALLTTGPIPERWLLLDGGTPKPSGDLTTAMRKHFGYHQMAGYIVKSGSNYYIRNFEGTDFLIPSAFVNKNCIDNANNLACFGYLTWK